MANKRNVDPTRHNRSEAEVFGVIVVVAGATNKYGCKEFGWKATNRRQGVLFTAKVACQRCVLGYLFVDGGLEFRFRSPLYRTSQRMYQANSGSWRIY